MDNILQLDDLVESDILEALGEVSSKVSNIPKKETLISDYQEVEDSISTHNKDLNLEVNSSKTIALDSTLTKDDLTNLINELISYKTLEITVKIKD